MRASFCTGLQTRAFLHGHLNNDLKQKTTLLVMSAWTTPGRVSVRSFAASNGFTVHVDKCEFKFTYCSTTVMVISLQTGRLFKCWSVTHTVSRLISQTTVRALQVLLYRSLSVNRRFHIPYKCRFTTVSTCFIDHRSI